MWLLCLNIFLSSISYQYKCKNNNSLNEQHQEQNSGLIFFIIVLQPFFFWTFSSLRACRFHLLRVVSCQFIIYKYLFRIGICPHSSVEHRLLFSCCTKSNSLYTYTHVHIIFARTELTLTLFSESFQNTSGLYNILICCYL